MHSTTQLRRHALTVAAMLVAMIGMFGCRSTDTALEDRDGRLIADRAPAMYRIALLPAVSEDAALGKRSEFRLVGDSGYELSTQFAAALNAMNAASEVVAIEADPREGGATELDSFDLVFKPRVQDYEFEEHSTRGAKAGVGTVLWLFTWVGGVVMDDKTFETGLVVLSDVRDRDMSILKQDARFESGLAGLSFFERNPAWSRGFFGSFFMPPFLIGSAYERTSETLSERASLHVAARWKEYLLDNLESTIGCEVRLVNYRNGQAVNGPVDIEVRIAASDSVGAVAVHVNDEPIDLALTTPELLSAPESGAGAEYRVMLEGVPLRRGANYIRFGIEFGARGRVTHRTLRLDNDV